MLKILVRAFILVFDAHLNLIVHDSCRNKIMSLLTSSFFFFLRLVVKRSFFSKVDSILKKLFEKVFCLRPRFQLFSVLQVQHSSS